METEQRGIRAVPPAMIVGLALPIVWAIARVVVLAGWKPAHGGFVPRLILVGEGVGFAVSALVLAGTIELARRMTGRSRIALNVAVAGSLVLYKLAGLM